MNLARVDIRHTVAAQKAGRTLDETVSAKSAAAHDSKLRQFLIAPPLPNLGMSASKADFAHTEALQPSMVLSTATRLAITGIAKTLPDQLAHDTILVNTLCPGLTDTDRMVSLIDFTQKEKGISREAAEAIWLEEVPLRRMGRAEDFGKLAAVLVSDVASYVTGAAVSIDGGKARAF